MSRPNAKPQVYKGIEYPSLTALADKLNISVSTLRSRLADGKDPAVGPGAPVNWNNGIPVEIRGVRYRSFVSAYKAVNPPYSFSVFKHRVRLRLSLDLPPPSSRKPCHYKGQDYASIRDAATDTGDEYTMVRRTLKPAKPRTRKGSSQAITVGGVTYPSTKAAWKALAPPVGYDAIRSRLSKGCTPDEAFSADPPGAEKTLRRSRADTRPTVGFRHHDFLKG